MQFDKLLMMADALAFDGTPDEIDLSVSKSGRGEPIMVAIVGQGLTGLTAVVFQTGDTSGSLANTLTLLVSPEEAEDGVCVSVPNNAGRYANISLTGATAGTYTAGLVKDCQTNL